MVYWGAAFMAIIPLAAGVRVEKEEAVPASDAMGKGLSLLEIGASVNAMAQLRSYWLSIGTRTTPQCVGNSKGKAIGCNNGCACGWSQQCYPFWTREKDSIKYHPEESIIPWDKPVRNNSGAHAGPDEVHAMPYASASRINSGICETSLPVLTLMSLLMFLLTLTSFVGLRTFFQLQAQAQEALADNMLQKHPGKLSILHSSLKGPANKNGGESAAKHIPDCDSDSDDDDAASLKPKHLGGKAESAASKSHSDSDDTDKLSSSGRSAPRGTAGSGTKSMPLPRDTASGSAEKFPAFGKSDSERPSTDSDAIVRQHSDSYKDQCKSRSSRKVSRSKSADKKDEDEEDFEF